MNKEKPENPAPGPADALRLEAAGPRTIAAGLALAVAGLALAFCVGWRGPESRTLFCHAYLVAFLFYLTIALGGLFFVLLHHLARAGWSVTLRRLAEALAANLGLLALLALPLVAGLWEVYPGRGPRLSVRTCSRPKPLTSARWPSGPGWPLVSPCGSSWPGTSAAARFARTPAATSG